VRTLAGLLNGAVTFSGLRGKANAILKGFFGGGVNNSSGARIQQGYTYSPSTLTVSAFGNFVAHGVQSITSGNASNVWVQGFDSADPNTFGFLNHKISASTNSQLSVRYFLASQGVAATRNFRHSIPPLNPNSSATSSTFSYASETFSNTTWSAGPTFGYPGFVVVEPNQTQAYYLLDYTSDYFFSAATTYGAFNLVNFTSYTIGAGWSHSSNGEVVHGHATGSKTHNYVYDFGNGGLIRNQGIVFSNLSYFTGGQGHPLGTSYDSGFGLGSHPRHQASTEAFIVGTPARTSYRFFASNETFSNTGNFLAPWEAVGGASTLYGPAGGSSGFMGYA
jgi:hypothetical protein